MAERQNENGRCGTRTHGLHDVNVAVISADELAGLAIKAMKLDVISELVAAILGLLDYSKGRRAWPEVQAAENALLRATGKTYDQIRFGQEGK